jgi:anaerobic ribonucleoside-triphosphate reductase activating protein
VQGCPWRCRYCHNPHLQPRTGPPVTDWEAVEEWLCRRSGLLDALVFSGGEPTLDPALPAAVAAARALGFRVGLHTAGIYPQRLAALLPALDWVGLDVKAPLADTRAHAEVTGRARSNTGPAAALTALLESGVDLECRTTAHPALLTDAALRALAASLAAAGVQRYALQLARPAPGADLPAIAPGYPSAATLRALAGLFASFEFRQAG